MTPDNKEPQPITDPGLTEVQSKTTSSSSPSGPGYPTGPQGARIPGYTIQSEANLAIFKAVKENEERTLRYLESLKGSGVDERWLAMAITSFQQAVMFILRSVAKPERIKLPEDPDYGQA